VASKFALPFAIALNSAWYLIHVIYVSIYPQNPNVLIPRYIDYPACIPSEQTIQVKAASKDWPEGRWRKQHSARAKDEWIGMKAREHLWYRRDIETSSNYSQLGINEWGEKKPPIRRFYKNNDCKHAYYALFCFINFPRCDMNPSRLLSLPTCRSACENYFIACGFSEDLWRCGKPKYYNADGPEEPSRIDPETGGPLYNRDYFPGSPFRKNRFKKDGVSDRAICTPAMPGAASRVGSVPGLVTTLGLLLCSTVGMLLAV